MKKFFSIIIAIVVMATCMVACGKESDIPAREITSTTEKAPELPKLSKDFIKTALQFMDNPTEAMAREILYLSGSFKSELFQYLTPYVLEEHGDVMKYYFGPEADRIYTVSVYISNGEYGGYYGGMEFNAQEPLYNFKHDRFILAAGVLCKEYSDIISSAEARIAAFALTQMYPDEACSTIRSNDEGEFYYDFTFENETFKGLIRETLEFLYKF